jgi:uncharacterized protein (DUF2141 family)
VHQILYSSLALVLLVLCSCASGQGTAPPGGPPDTTAPHIVTTFPANGSTNFHDNVISAEFSEFVDENRARQAVVITPIPSRLPKFSWSGRTLDIEFTTPLLNNRTYAVTFGADITDLANNRLGHPFTLRFSTGDVIDSGRIQGQVTGVERRRACIFAYTLPHDTTGFAASFRPDSTQPDFIAPVADDGTFSLEGLPNGSYRLFAVTDESGDQRYTPGIDAYGVAVNDVTITTQTEPVTGATIRLQRAPIDLLPPTLFSASPLYGTRTALRFNEPIDTATLRQGNITMSVAEGPVVVLQSWRSPTSWNIVEIEHQALTTGSKVTVQTHNLRDTAGNALPDSVAATTFTAIDTRDTIPPTLMPVGIDTLHGYTFPDSIRISFNEGVTITETGTVVSIRDSSGKQATFNLRQQSPTSFIAVPRDSLIGISRAELRIDLGKVVDIAHNRRDSVMRIPIAVAPGRQNGTMQGTLTDTTAPNAAHVIVARLVATGALFKKVGVRTGPWEFTSIPEGEYEISAFRDSDNDGEYDYGAIAPYRPAEAYTSWRGTVRVRPRWVTNKVDLVIPGGR